ncbi:cupredoxin family copper-binding protein [Chloroflexota bacterium]
MKTYLGNTIKYHNLLNTILSVALIFAVTFALSCQSQAPEQVPPEPSNGLPLAPTSEEPPVTPPQIEVAIDGLAFNPAVLNVPVGTTVVWYNNDSVTHTITARDNLFDSGNLDPGDTFRYTFEQSGELEYYCKIHPSIVGEITIE